MARLSSVEREMLRNLRVAEADASSAAALAARALAILQVALAFDEGYIFAVDPDSLLFTRVLAYRGDQFERLVSWLRDVYLVYEREAVPDITFPSLLRDHGGLVFAHERLDRWIGAVPRPSDQAAWAQFWRAAESPPGGGIRVGFAHRGRWVAAMQAARWQPGDGFRAHDAQALRRAAPGLASALSKRLQPVDPAAIAVVMPPPGAGHLLFDPDRRLAYIDAPGEMWIKRIPDDGVPTHLMTTPVVAQSLVNHLASDPAPEASSRLVDKLGFGVVVSATRARPAVGRRQDPGDWIHVTIRSEPLATPLEARSLTARQREVGLAVARGLTDRVIAERLSISVATVHDHVAALHRAYGTDRRSLLVAALSSAVAHGQPA